jgi:hypothetical protein
MELHEALRQIADIRCQMERGTVYRGYRAMMVGATGVLAVLAAAIQRLWVPSPGGDLERYLGLWVGVATASLVAAGVEMSWRAWGSGPGLARKMTLLAVEQFLPSVAVGAILTICIARGAPEAAWMLPGLWALIFSLGVFASHRLLPRQVAWVGVYYVLCGCGCLVWGRGEQALAPWLMGITFGGGQFLGAAILHWTLERTDVARGHD